MSQQNKGGHEKMSQSKKNKSIFKQFMDEGYYNFNLDNIEGVKPNKGYMVSVKDYATMSEYDVKTNPRRFDSRILQAIAELETFRKTNKNVFVGLWFNHGVYYIDFSAQIMDKEEAIALGMQHKQIAIFDLNEASEIIL